jgi:hypothetical protein
VTADRRPPTADRRPPTADKCNALHGKNGWIRAVCEGAGNWILAKRCLSVNLLASTVVTVTEKRVHAERSPSPMVITDTGKLAFIRGMVFIA